MEQHRCFELNIVTAGASRVRIEKRADAWYIVLMSGLGASEMRANFCPGCGRELKS